MGTIALHCCLSPTQATCLELDLRPSMYNDAVHVNAAVQIVLNYVAVHCCHRPTSTYGNVRSVNRLNAGTLHPVISHALATVAAVLSTTCWSLNVSLSCVACCCCCCCCRAASSVVAWVSNCGTPSMDYSVVLIHSRWQHLTTWVASEVSITVSDRTLAVLIDHLRDLDFPTILARMADRSEP